MILNYDFFSIDFFFRLSYLSTKQSYPGSSKKTETMKQFFLWAVVISALCSSCDSKEDLFSDKVNSKQYSSKINSVDDYIAYKNVMSSFVYNPMYSYNVNLQRYEEHVNLYLYSNENDKYIAIDLERLSLLLNVNEASFVEHLDYTSEAKKIMIDILNYNYNSAAEAYLVLNENENRIVQTLFAMHNEGNDDDLWKGRRNIAFAYGAQYSFKQAVLYAGAVELRGSVVNN